MAFENNNKTSGCENEMKSTYGIETCVIMYIEKGTELSIDSDEVISQQIPHLTYIL